MSELNDIWMNNKGKLPEDKLLAYLEGRLPADEQHEIEQWLAEEGMESDALEGLHSLPAGEARYAANKINHELRKTLAGKKRRRRQIKDNPWSWLAIVIIIILAVLAYVVIWMHVHKTDQSQKVTSAIQHATQDDNLIQT